MLWDHLVLWNGIQYKYSADWHLLSLTRSNVLGHSTSCGREMLLDFSAITIAGVFSKYIVDVDVQALSICLRP
jgi:hypothetical protein